MLLDTHIWIWSLIEPGQLSPKVANQLENPENQIWLSPISVWETLVLAERGRLQLDGPAKIWVEATLRAFPIREAPLTREVAIVSRTVDLPHQDPADRFIAASAVVHDLTLVTADHRLLGTTEYQTLLN